MSAPPKFCLLEFRLAPEYRRCGVYVAVGYLVVAAAVVGSKLSGIDNRPWSSTIALLATFGAGSLFVVALIFRYRLRIDHHGVWRRRFIRWDLWPWEAFEQGKVRCGKLGDQLTYPEKSWYWRTISSSVLGEENRFAYETIVGRYRVPPPPPVVPEALTLKNPLYGTLELSAAGVRRIGRGESGDKVIPWREIVKADVVRYSHDRPDFTTLDLHLPDRPKPVRLIRRDGAMNWSGADAEVVSLFLQRHLDDGRFQVTALRGPPTDVAETDRRLARLDTVEQQLRKTKRFLWYLSVSGTVIMSVVILALGNRPNPMNWGRADWIDAATVVGLLSSSFGFHIVLHYVVDYFRRRDLRRERDEVLRWRAELKQT